MYRLYVARLSIRRRAFLCLAEAAKEAVQRRCNGPLHLLWIQWRLNWLLLPISAVLVRADLLMQLLNIEQPALRFTSHAKVLASFQQTENALFDVERAG